MCKFEELEDLRTGEKEPLLKVFGIAVIFVILVVVIGFLVSCWFF